VSINGGSSRVIVVVLPYFPVVSAIAFLRNNWEMVIAEKRKMAAMLDITRFLLYDLLKMNAPYSRFLFRKSRSSKLRGTAIVFDDVFILTSPFRSMSYNSREINKHCSKK
jgi:hypothetical protein